MGAGTWNLRFPQRRALPESLVAVFSAPTCRGPAKRVPFRRRASTERTALRRPFVPHGAAVSDLADPASPVHEASAWRQNGFSSLLPPCRQGELSGTLSGEGSTRSPRGKASLVVVLGWLGPGGVTFVVRRALP
jgi:hypothetical protein